MASRDERVLRWTHVDVADLDLAPAEPSDAELVERAAKHLACRRPDCEHGDGGGARLPSPDHDALAPTVVITASGPRWIDLCVDCANLLAREIGETCDRPGCGRAAPPGRSRGGWCPTCCGRLHSAIARSADLRVELLASLVPSLQAGGAPVSGSKEPPAPLRIGILSTAEQLTTLMADAEDLLRAHLQDAPATRVVLDRWQLPHPVSPAERWGRARTYVLGAWLQLLDVEAGRQVGAQLMSMTAAASKLLGKDRLVHTLEAPCPSCDTLSLRRHDGADRVECEMCGRTETEATYGWLSKAAVDAYDTGDTGHVRKRPHAVVGDLEVPRSFGTGGATVRETA